MLAKSIMLPRAPGMHSLLDLAGNLHQAMHGATPYTVSDFRFMMWVQVLPRPKEGLLSRMMRLSEVAHTSVEGVQVTCSPVARRARRDVSAAHAQQAASCPVCSNAADRPVRLRHHSKAPC